MDWAGKAVEAASGQLLDVHLREQIFAPLGMSSTSFILSPQQRARPWVCTRAKRMDRCNRCRLS